MNRNISQVQSSLSRFLKNLEDNQYHGQLSKNNSRKRSETCKNSYQIKLMSLEYKIKDSNSFMIMKRISWLENYKFLNSRTRDFEFCMKTFGTNQENNYNH